MFGVGNNFMIKKKCKFIILLFLLVLFNVSSSAASLLASQDNKTTLYDDVTASSTHLEPIYGSVNCNNHCCVIERNGKYGLMKNDEIWREPYYDEIISYSKGEAFILRKGNFYGYGYCDGGILEPQFESVEEAQPLYQIAMKPKRYGKYGYVSKEGINIPCLYDEVEYLENKILKVKKGKKYGYITFDNFKQNNFNVDFLYDDILKIPCNDVGNVFRWNYELIKVVKNGKVAYLSKENKLGDFVYDDITFFQAFNQAGFFKIKQNNKYGLLIYNAADRSVAEYISPIYDDVISINNEGLVIVENEGKKGIVKANDALFLPIKYNDVKVKKFRSLYNRDFGSEPMIVNGKRERPAYPFRYYCKQLIRLPYNAAQAVFLAASFVVCPPVAFYGTLKAPSDNTDEYTQK